MLKFLKKQAKSTFERIGTITAGYFVTVLATIGAVKFYSWLFELDQSSSGFGFTIFDQFFAPYKHLFAIQFFFGCIIAPLIEEILFRHLPLQVIRATKKEELLVPTILFTSVVFGLMHEGAASIPIQGVFGLIASIVYLKNGYSYISSVALHAIWNTSLLLGILNI